MCGGAWPSQVQPQAQVRVLHDGQALIKATNSTEAVPPAKHRLIAKQAAQAPAPRQASFIVAPTNRAGPVDQYENSSGCSAVPGSLDGTE